MKHEIASTKTMIKLEQSSNLEFTKDNIHPTSSIKSEVFIWDEIGVL